jgi:molybdopterin-guanine dinucleotide biosynthesis protein A
MNNDVLGVILAGGASRRFGGDKAQALLAGRPLLEWVAGRARAQVGRLLVNANDHLADCAGLERLSDEAPGQGPLAGILAALAEAKRCGLPLVATFACDTPFFPADTVTKLRDALATMPSDFAMARCGAISHRIFALWRVDCLPRLAAAFGDGERALHEAEHHLACSRADFAAQGGPGGDPFFNINTQDDLDAAQQWLAARRAETR